MNFMHSFAGILVLVASFVFCSPSAEATTNSIQNVYQATNVWSDSFEDDYSKWVQENADEEFMVRYQIATDCGQMPAAFRLIYSRIHSLPALIVSGNTRIGHFSKEFNEVKFYNLPTYQNWTTDNWKELLKKDLRFRAFLEKALSLINTATLGQNTFQVLIRDNQNPDRISPMIRPGIIELDERHARMIVHVEDGAVTPIKELQSTLPPKIRSLLATPFTLFHFPNSKTRGLMSWLWPVSNGSDWRLTKPENMNGYFKGQSELPDASYEDAIKELASVEFLLKRLPESKGIPQLGELPSNLSDEKARELRASYMRFDSNTSAERTVLEDRYAVLKKTINLYKTIPDLKFKGTISQQLMELLHRRAPTIGDIRAEAASIAARLQSGRVPLVQASAQLTKANPHTFDNSKSTLYDSYSTPDRDHFELFILSHTMDSYRLADPSGMLSFRYAQALRNQKIEIRPGIQIDLHFWYQALGNGAVLGHPGASFKDRWGLGYAEEVARKKPSLEFEIDSLKQDLKFNELDLERCNADDRFSDAAVVIEKIKKQKIELSRLQTEIKWMEDIQRSGLNAQMD